MNSNPTYPVNVPLLSPTIPVEDTLREFKRLFQGRADVYAIQKPNGGYRTVRQPASDKVLRSHLSGDITIGVYLITPVEDTCRFTAIDVDKRSTTMARSLIRATRALGLADNEFLLESSGNKGFHLWIFYADKVPAGRAMLLGKIICKEAGMFGKVEIFPKQSHVSEGQFGNLIKLPGRHAVSGRYSRFFSVDIHPQDVGWLRCIRQLSPQRLSQILAAKEDHMLPVTNPSKIPRPSRKNIPCIDLLFAGVQEGNRNYAALRLAVFLKDHGLPLGVTVGTLNVWNESNQPPLSPGELNNTIQHVYRKDYHGYNCHHAQMQQFCDRESCPVERARRRPTASR